MAIWSCISTQMPLLAIAWCKPSQVGHDLRIAGIPSYLRTLQCHPLQIPHSVPFQNSLLRKRPQKKEIDLFTDIGSINQVLGRVIQKKAGIEFIEVDGGNAVNRVAALKGKQIDLVCLPYNVGKDYVTNGDF